MNIIDWFILLILFLSFIRGFRKGFLSSVVTFVGSILIFVLAFYLKNPISTFLYEKLPFFTIGDKFSGIYAYNILIYEAISYLIAIFLLGIVFKIINKITGIVTFIINATIILGIPNKLLGALVGLVQGFLISFVLIFTMQMIGYTSKQVAESKFAHNLLEKTPVLSNMISKSYESIKEIYNIASNSNLNKDVANLESIDVLLESEIITLKSTMRLIESNKIKIPGINEIIDKYK